MVAVLLLMLWVRSYWWVEIYYGQVSANQFICLGILPGALGGSVDDINLPSTRTTVPTDKWLESTGRTISRVVKNQKRLEQSNPQLLKKLRPPPRLPSRIWGVLYFRKGEAWVPFWFLSLLTVALATLPWIKWSKRFALRTLLLITTAVAILLGLIIYAIRS